MPISRILVYTRQPMDEAIYSPKLALSVHLARLGEDGAYAPLNRNSGVLFARATENADSTLNAKCLVKPWAFVLRDGSFAVVAIRTDASGADDPESRGWAFLYRTRDFLHFDDAVTIELGRDAYPRHLLCESMVADVTVAESADTAGADGVGEGEAYALLWRDESGAWWRTRFLLADCDEAASAQTGDSLSRTPPASASPSCRSFPPEPTAAPVQLGRVSDRDVESIEGCIPGNTVDVSLDIAESLSLALTSPVNVGVYVPEGRVASPDGLKSLRAISEYSDGTNVARGVDWEIEAVDFNQFGKLSGATVSGNVRQSRFCFPFAVNRADPCVAEWNGRYYFLATNDADGNHTLYLRSARDLPGLADAEERLFLDSSTYPEIGNLLWAPELRRVGEDLYVFFAASPGDFFREASRVMRLRRGGDPANRSDWSRPELVVGVDGEPLAEAGREISLDMTCFEWEGAWYAVWAQRRFVPVDTGSWLYIAPFDPDMPWRLTGKSAVIAKPELGWENNHTFVVEGPCALVSPASGRLFLTYSGAAVDSTYSIGLLSLRPGADPLQPASWEKQGYPLLTSRSVPGEFGPGHNSYVTDRDGLVWSVYHARDGLDGPRCTGFRRVHFGPSGRPVLEVTAEDDLREAFSQVCARLSATGTTQSVSI